MLEGPVEVAPGRVIIAEIVLEEAEVRLQLDALQNRVLACESPRFVVLLQCLLPLPCAGEPNAEVQQQIRPVDAVVLGTQSKAAGGMGDHLLVVTLLKCQGAQHQRASDAQLVACVGR